MCSVLKNDVLISVVSLHLPLSVAIAQIRFLHGSRGPVYDLLVSLLPCSCFFFFSRDGAGLVQENMLENGGEPRTINMVDQASPL